MGEVVLGGVSQNPEGFRWFCSFVRSVGQNRFWRFWHCDWPTYGFRASRALVGSTSYLHRWKAYLMPFRLYIKNIKIGLVVHELCSFKGHRRFQKSPFLTRFFNFEPSNHPNAYDFCHRSTFEPKATSIMKTLSIYTIWFSTQGSKISGTFKIAPKSP